MFVNFTSNKLTNAIKTKKDFYWIPFQIDKYYVPSKSYFFKFLFSKPWENVLVVLLFPFEIEIKNVTLICYTDTCSSQRNSTEALNKLKTGLPNQYLTMWKFLQSNHRGPICLLYPTGVDDSILEQLGIHFSFECAWCWERGGHL